jgi:MoxR-like ATPase
MKIQDLQMAIKANLPVIAIDSAAADERILVSYIKTDLLHDIELPMFFFDQSSGLSAVNSTTTNDISFERIAENEVPIGPEGIDRVLDYINAPSVKTGVFILADIHIYLPGGKKEDAFITRRLKNLCFDLRVMQKRVLLVGQGIHIGQEMMDLIYYVENPLPNTELLNQTIFHTASAMQSSFQRAGRSFQIDIKDSERELLIRAAQGLTCTGVQDVIKFTSRKFGRLGSEAIEFMLNFKYDKLRQMNIEFAQPPDVPVGGMGLFKDWARSRVKLFGKEARDLGLPMPKGAVLVGLPGCGKSLITKTLGHEWGMPTLTMNMGTLQGSYVGESEGNLKAALKSAEAVAPCILVLDEMDKAFSSIGGDTSGVMTRMFGQFLTWMSDKTDPVFVIATANDVKGLPPELMRKGRFDEVFFVNLPTKEERIEILSLHLAHRGGGSDWKTHIQLEDLERLAADTGSFSGSELAAAVDEAAIQALNDDRPQQIRYEDLKSQIEMIEPLAVSEKSKFEVLLAWGKTARQTSSHEVREEFHDVTDSLLLGM